MLSTAVFVVPDVDIFCYAENWDKNSDECTKLLTHTKSMIFTRIFSTNIQVCSETILSFCSHSYFHHKFFGEKKKFNFFSTNLFLISLFVVCLFVSFVPSPYTYTYTDVYVAA